MGLFDTTPALRDTPKGRFVTFLYRSFYLANILHMERSDLNNGRNRPQKGQIAPFWYEKCRSAPNMEQNDLQKSQNLCLDNQNITNIIHQIVQISLKNMCQKFTKYAKIY